MDLFCTLEPKALNEFFNDDITELLCATSALLPMPASAGHEFTASLAADPMA